jgi:peptidoglycan hydrolase-like protein with peptidoglycan-binding domain
MSWDPSAHPRAAAGAAGGGQFAPLGYDSGKKTGTGYGKKGGDSRVRTAQAALNRLGLTDSKGAKLATDGKLGPLTTQSIQAAQRRLGVKADGKITPAFLAKLKATKALPGGKAHKKTALAPKKKAPKKPVSVAPVGPQR